MPPEAPTFVPEEEQLIEPEGTDFSHRAQRMRREKAEAKLDVSEDNDRAFIKVLDLFGTTAARENFLELCRQYVENYALDTASYVEEFSTVRSKLARTTKLQERQSYYHNKLMEVLRKLISAQTPHSENWELLEKFQNRDVVEDVVVRGDWRDLLPPSRKAAA